ncbi:hypothetical protein [Pseudalkalibacillus caeni]|uniref:PepSY domain-containing protein n=1 Tax=Exobacillus caeni TaxID=2574798 RepID=A0A5R9F5S5_9BACL|nr:hypothetical protein [Pseudalkalibacillus caeni]TLS36163.1 hypothetical protein FCL54_16125 [Pseudalkalibacillus caeni]
MKRCFTVLLVIVILTTSLISCSNESFDHKGKTGSGDTLSDQIAEEKGILSKDDAEALVYNQLNDEEKQNCTIDFYKEEGTKYFIRVYETVNGNEKVKKKYTVDFHTEEIQQIQ